MQEGAAAAGYEDIGPAHFNILQHPTPDGLRPSELATGAQFTKLARAIQVAAREGGGDPEMNAALANAVQKAKDASMPKDNIERAIAKGTGAGTDADAFETVVYEGYGPAGVAILVEALT